MINLHSFRPLDWETIFKSVTETHRVMTMELGWPVSGMSSEIVTTIMENPILFQLDISAVHCTSIDVPMPWVENIEYEYTSKDRHIVDFIKKVYIMKM